MLHKLRTEKNSNLSVNKLCDKLEIKRSTLITKLQKENYFFNINNGSYAIDGSMEDVIKNDDTNKNNDISTNNSTMKEVIINNDNDMTFSHQIKSNLMELAKNYDKIMTLINSDKNMNDSIIIELPVETKDNYRTTIRINNVVWENFKEFRVQNKMLAQRDLLSMALTEYVNKYKK